MKVRIILFLFMGSVGLMLIACKQQYWFRSKVGKKQPVDSTKVEREFNVVW